MYIHVDYRWFKTILKIDMKKLLALLLIVFSCQFSFAADQGDWFLQRQISIGDGKNAYGKNVIGQSARAVMENVPIKGTTQTEVRELIKRSIAADKPTAAKVGSSMLKRIYSPQAIVGTAAVTGLLAAIGWVMDEGTKTYVKEVPEGGDFICETQTASTPVEACQKVLDAEASRLGYSPTNNYYEKIEGIDTQTLQSNGKYSFLMCSSWKMREGTCQFKRLTAYGRYTSSKKVPLTAALLGAAMLGSQYADPDPNFDNDTVNTGDYTGVKETYEHDPSGVGDELADKMDDKLKNAKPTDDSKPSWVGDPKYDDRPLAEDDKSSDRSWTEKGDEATGGTEPEKDPETGEATGNQSITLKFPLFCSWASKMCLWYDDWKASDKIYKEHMTKTEDHQASEKSFWATVKDWFDWSKENDDLDNDTDLPEIKDIPIGTLDTSAFKGTPGCPSSIQVPVAFAKSGNVEISYEPICAMASKWSFVAPFIGFFSGALIILGVGRKGEDSDT